MPDHFTLRTEHKPCSIKSVFVKERNFCINTLFCCFIGNRVSAGSNLECDMKFWTCRFSVFGEHMMTAECNGITHVTQSLVNGFCRNPFIGVIGMVVVAVQRQSICKNKICFTACVVSVFRIYMVISNCLFKVSFGSNHSFVRIYRIFFVAGAIGGKQNKFHIVSSRTISLSRISLFFRSRSAPFQYGLMNTFFPVAYLHQCPITYQTSV